MSFRSLMQALAICLVPGILAAEAEPYFADYYYVPAPAGKAADAISGTPPKGHALADALVRDFVRSDMPVLDIAQLPKPHRWRKRWTRAFRIRRHGAWMLVVKPALCSVNPVL